MRNIKPDERFVVELINGQMVVAVSDPNAEIPAVVVVTYPEGTKITDYVGQEWRVRID